VADPAGREPYEHLSRLRLGEVDLLDDERLPEVLEHGGTDLHATNLEPWRPSGVIARLRVSPTQRAQE
jgi:hypothetical protein